MEKREGLISVGHCFLRNKKVRQGYHVSFCEERERNVNADGLERKIYVKK
jgi:hypothetical protein